VRRQARSDRDDTCSGDQGRSPLRCPTPAPATRGPAKVARRKNRPSSPRKAPEKPAAEKPVEKPAAASVRRSPPSSLEDDGGPGGGDNSVPEGSTVFDVPAISRHDTDRQPVAKDAKDKMKDVKKNQEARPTLLGPSWRSTCASRATLIRRR
jgi:hypothetical protein